MELHDVVKTFGQLSALDGLHVAPELNSEAAQLMAGALWDSDDPPTSASVREQSP